MQKLGRNYKLLVGLPGAQAVGGPANGQTLTIELPFTVEFDITRNTLTSANVCSIRIYNLSQNNRNQIRYNIMDSGAYRPVVLFGGYGSNLSVIFSGNITQAWSVREGVNFITTIECFDGGYAFNTGFTNTTFPAGTSIQSVITNLAASLPQVKLGIIGTNYTGVLPRDNSLNGSTVELLKYLTGGGVFIDNQIVNCLSDNECVPANGITVIDDSSGLLGTPVRELTIIRFDMIFEPRVIVGQQIFLNSSTGSNFNGFYKVVSVKHRGTVSGAVCGDAITTLGMFFGTAALSTIAPTNQFAAVV